MIYRTLTSLLVVCCFNSFAFSQPANNAFAYIQQQVNGVCLMYTESRESTYYWSTTNHYMHHCPSGNLYCYTEKSEGSPYTDDSLESYRYYGTWKLVQSQGTIQIVYRWQGGGVNNYGVYLDQYGKIQFDAQVAYIGAAQCR